MEKLCFDICMFACNPVEPCLVELWSFYFFFFYQITERYVFLLDGLLVCCKQVESTKCLMKNNISNIWKTGRDECLREGEISAWGKGGRGRKTGWECAVRFSKPLPYFRPKHRILCSCFRPKYQNFRPVSDQISKWAKSTTKIDALFQTQMLENGTFWATNTDIALEREGKRTQCFRKKGRKEGREREETDRRVCIKTEFLIFRTQDIH